MSRRGALAGTAIAVGALVLGAAGAWYAVLRDDAEPVGVDEAVESFRTDTEPTPGAPSPIPEGVYVYETAGRERTDALTGVTHTYPRRSTITVTSAACGARLTWKVLDGRSTEWVYCATPDGLELASQDERHMFFGRTERTTYRCSDTPIRPAGALAGQRWEVACTTGEADERGVGMVVGVSPLHVRKRTAFTGAIRGTAAHDLWFDAGTGVPVRLVMETSTTNDSPVGDVHYEEKAELTLVSRTPRR
jgi:hypothetical protein